MYETLDVATDDTVSVRSRDTLKIFGAQSYLWND